MKYCLCFESVGLCWAVYEYTNDSFILLEVFYDLFDALNYYKCLLEIG